MGFGLGDILGSISPAFGMASGDGIFGNRNIMGSISPLFGMESGKGLFGGLGGMGGMGLGGILGMLMGSKSGGSSNNAAPPAAPVMPQLSGPSLSSVASTLPQGIAPQSPNPLSMLGSALQNGPKDTAPVQVQQAYAPQRQIDDSMIMQLLGSIGQGRMGQGSFV